MKVNLKRSQTIAFSHSEQYFNFKPLNLWHRYIGIRREPTGASKVQSVLTNANVTRRDCGFM